ncbi:MAG TPA: hypothetical protein VG347_04870 [Verrucomicrobiae bacterium]|nr:hypothetical protein [Verrucomicrobiae bacterium]
MNNSAALDLNSADAEMNSWYATGTPDPKPKIEHPELISKVSTFFGGTVEPLALQVDDEKFSKPLQKLLAHYKTGYSPDTIAVPCGFQSDGLCAIVFLTESTAVLSQLIELNPLLVSAVTTHWRQFSVLWFKASGWRPMSLQMAGWVWVADGYVPFEDVIPSKKQVIPAPSGQPIPTLVFDDLKWPQSAAKTFILEKVQAYHGRLILKPESGGGAINHSSAAHFLRERDGYIYNQHTGGFSRMLPEESKFEAITETRIKQVVTDLLYDLSALNRQALPVSKIKACDVKVIIDLLRLYCAEKSEDERTGLVRFVDERVETRHGADITIDEMHGGYISYCQANKLQVCPRSMFLKEIPSMIRRRFSALKSHSLKRPTADGEKLTARNGFFGLAMKQVRDDKDGRDGNDG